MFATSPLTPALSHRGEGVQEGNEEFSLSLKERGGLGGNEEFPLSPLWERAGVRGE